MTCGVWESFGETLVLLVVRGYQRLDESLKRQHRSRVEMATAFAETIPLVKPDWRISRIRLSRVVHRLAFVRAVALSGFQPRSWVRWSHQVFPVGSW